MHHVDLLNAADELQDLGNDVDRIAFIEVATLDDDVKQLPTLAQILQSKSGCDAHWHIVLDHH